MPPRLPGLSQSILNFARHPPARPKCRHTAPFTTSCSRLAQAASSDSLPDHYATLELPPTATATEIKKQFYTLSKRHHPDTLRSSLSSSSPPPSSDRFHAINDAYHTLSDPAARTRYDRDFARVYGFGPSRSPTYRPSPGGGTYASHAGSRPASGLSRRRTQFRGPPPSFYANGGWGGAEGKRAANAEAGPDASGWGGGFGPGQRESGSDEEIPYWNRTAHQRTQEGVAETVGRRRRRREAGGGSVDGDTIFAADGDAVFNFIVVSGAVLIVMAVPIYLMGQGEDREKPRKEREGKG